jgi:heterodisulfide reductase subunit B
MATNRAYDISTRSVASALGMGMIELDDWNCCGATTYMPIREKRAFVLSARNLAIAEKQGRELATVCNACYVVLRKTNKYMAEDTRLRGEIRKALQVGGMDYHGRVVVRHFLEILVNDLGEEAIKRHVVLDLSRLKVACYSGCQLSRPFEEVDHPEYPEMMDRLVGWLGAQVVPFPMRAKCCGGMSMTTHPETGRGLSGKILKHAKASGADCIATACPLCQVNLEAYQDKVAVTVGADCKIPVVYFTQLAGVAFGLKPEHLALKDSLTPVEALFAEKVGS